MVEITINGIRQQCVIKQSSTLSDFGDGTGTDYILVKTYRPLTDDDRRHLLTLAEGTQSGQVELVGDDLYLCHYGPNDLAPVQALDFVEGVQIYRRAFKLAKPLKQIVSLPSADDVAFEIIVTLHSNRKEVPSILEIKHSLSEILKLEEGDLEVDTAGDFDLIVIKNVKSSNLQDVEKATAIDAVRAIERIVPKMPHNDHARRILGLDDSFGPTMSFQGEGQVLAIADTGLDIGTIEGIHPAFEGRIKRLVPVGRPLKALTDDRHGHGTHVCGSAVGNLVPSEKGYKNVQGVAPKATVVFQSLYRNGSEPISVPVGSELAKLFTDPYDHDGVRVHSNSWGDANRDQLPQPPYSLNENFLIDQLLWERPDLLLVISAGNDGASVNLPTISGISACKNVLTVGATESTRPSVHGVPSVTKKSNNDPSEVSWYSARGPTREQRTKPDLLAPGTAILSARTQAIPKPTNFTPADASKLYCYGWGTSMATPLVAGCALVLREFLMKTYQIGSPSAALLKALLINGAYATHHAHGGREGFGLVNLPNSMILKDTADAGFVEGKPFDAKDQTFETVVSVHDVTIRSEGDDEKTPRGGSSMLPEDLVSPLRVSPPGRRGQTFKATLAWTDPPGELLQNNLTLSVIDADKTTRNGNRGSSKLIDHYNNVQQIVWKGITPGRTTLRVTATSITQPKQPFALVWRVIPNED